jgi:hypothetical protein
VKYICIFFSVLLLSMVECRRSAGVLLISCRIKKRKVFSDTVKYFLARCCLSRVRQSFQRWKYSCATRLQGLQKSILNIARNVYSILIYLSFRRHILGTVKRVLFRFLFLQNRVLSRTPLDSQKARIKSMSVRKDKHSPLTDTQMSNLPILYLLHEVYLFFPLLCLCYSFKIFVRCPHGFKGAKASDIRSLEFS